MKFGLHETPEVSDLWNRYCDSEDSELLKIIFEKAKLLEIERNELLDFKNSMLNDYDRIEWLERKFKRADVALLKIKDEVKIPWDSGDNISIICDEYFEDNGIDR